MAKSLWTWIFIKVPAPLKPLKRNTFQYIQSIIHHWFIWCPPLWVKYYVGQDIKQVHRVFTTKKTQPNRCIEGLHYLPCMSFNPSNFRFRPILPWWMWLSGGLKIPNFLRNCLNRLPFNLPRSPQCKFYGRPSTTMKCLKELLVFLLVSFSQGTKLYNPNLLVLTKPPTYPEWTFFWLEVVIVEGFKNFCLIFIPQMSLVSPEASSQWDHWDNELRRCGFQSSCCCLQSDM